MKHKHRIKPGYEGGEYVEGNVVELSPICHSMWHFATWKRTGNWQDRLAWKGLSGVSSKEEIVHQANKQGGKITSTNKTGIHDKNDPRVKEGNRKGGHKAGLKNGKVCAENGHMDRMREKSLPKRRKKVIAFGENLEPITFISLNEAGKFFGCSYTTVRNYINSGQKLKGRRVKFFQDKGD